jgi:hypothetical protein
MSVRSASSLLQAVFVCAVSVAYLGVGAGLVGLVEASSAALVVFGACAIGCAAGLVLFLVWQHDLRSPVRHRITPVQ